MPIGFGARLLLLERACSTKVETYGEEHDGYTSDVMDTE